VWIAHLPLTEDGVNAALWFAAVVLSLPLLIATYRKLQALGMLLADLRVRRLQSDANAEQIKNIISTTVPLAGAMGMALLLFLLSSTLLPSWRILIVLLLILAGVTFLLWRSFVKVYSQAQFALYETLAQTPLPHETETPAPLQNLLREAKLETLVLAESSSAKGKLIRELELRTKTGASIVAIERNGTSMVNPDPHEELQAGDQVLLLGNQTQLEKARTLLSGGKNAV
jgi:CPA2 family monovalent cation:H+ antiporter-2